MRLVLKVLSSAVAMVSATAASAAVVDPAGDYLATYTGPANPDLDILAAQVTFDGSAFALSTTEAGAIGTTAGSLFVWAVDRGSGIARPTLAPPAGSGLLWDAVIVMFPDGLLRVVTFPSAGPPSITGFAGGTLVAGDTLSALVPLSLLPSTGFDPADYTFSLWSRARVNPALDGANTEVADLLAGSGALTATSVPEPGTWLTMLLGFGLIGGLIRVGKARRLAAAS